MKNMRDQFVKASKMPSGSGALSGRQREVLRLCSFLRVHIRGRETTSNFTDDDDDVNGVFVFVPFTSCHGWRVTHFIIS